MSQFRIERTLQLLTATFAHGAYQVQGFNDPHIRPASIRGQLRWWFDALFGDRRAEDAIFGCVRDDPHASNVIVRLRDLEIEKAVVDFMPHKKGGQKNALMPHSKFQLQILERRTPLGEDERSRLEKCVDAWLLLGAIGQRANRAAGSVWPDNAPESESDFLATAAKILEGTPLRVAVLPGTYSSEKSLRCEAGDFLRSEDVRNPFGTAGARQRKPSQLRLRAIHLDNSLRLAAIWDGRYDSFESLQRGVTQLVHARKPIGLKLENVLSRLKLSR